MGLFGAAHGWGGGGGGRAKKPVPPPVSKICHTYPTIMKLGTVIPYTKKMQRMHKLRDTFLSFCCHQYFFTGNQHNFVISRNTVIDCI